MEERHARRSEGVHCLQIEIDRTAYHDSRMAEPGAGFDATVDMLIALVRPHVIDGVPVSVGASVGVAQWPEDGADADALFDFADRALYQAKAEAHGGNAAPPAEPALRA